MEHTTHFALHYQATRLRDDAEVRPREAARGLTPAVGSPFQRNARDREPERRRHRNATFPGARRTRDSALGFSLFARRYWGNPS